MPLHRDPRERLDVIEDSLDRDSVDPELRDEIEAELPSVYQEYIALQSELAFEKHLDTYVRGAYLARQRGERDAPLCSCSIPTCPLTNGSLPAKLQYNADSVFRQTDGRKRVTEYLHSHDGAEILHETLEAWDEREGELNRKISSILVRLKKDEAKDLREVPSIHE